MNIPCFLHLPKNFGVTQNRQSLEHRFRRFFIIEGHDIETEHFFALQREVSLNSIASASHDDGFFLPDTKTIKKMLRHGSKEWKQD
ncbi:Uncharacterised protein [Enterobacter cloacae]|nr:Uncharacterised protein [Enterobacter cloacae]